MNLNLVNKISKYIFVIIFFGQLPLIYLEVIAIFLPFVLLYEFIPFAILSYLSNYIAKFNFNNREVNVENRTIKVKTFKLLSYFILPAYIIYFSLLLLNIGFYASPAIQNAEVVTYINASYSINKILFNSNPEQYHKVTSKADVKSLAESLSKSGSDYTECNNILLTNSDNINYTQTRARKECVNFYAIYSHRPELCLINKSDVDPLSCLDEAIVGLDDASKCDLYLNVFGTIDSKGVNFKKEECLFDIKYTFHEKNQTTFTSYDKRIMSSYLKELTRIGTVMQNNFNKSRLTILGDSVCSNLIKDKSNNFLANLISQNILKCNGNKNGFYLSIDNWQNNYICIDNQYNEIWSTSTKQYATKIDVWGNPICIVNN